VTIQCLLWNKTEAKQLAGSKMYQKKCVSECVQSSEANLQHDVVDTKNLQWFK